MEQQGDRVELFLEKGGSFKVHTSIWKQVRDVSREANGVVQEQKCKTWEIQQVKKTVMSSATSLLKNVMGVFMGAVGVDNLVDLGGEIPWVGSIIKLGSMIHVGVNEVLENYKNFQRLRGFIIGVIVTIEHSSSKSIETFKAANKDMSQYVGTQFEQYMVQGVQLVAKFQERQAFEKFVTRERDSDEFESIQWGLSSTLTLLNTNMIMVQLPQQQKNNQEDQDLKKLFKELGNGDEQKGQQMYHQYLVGQDQDKYQYILQVIVQNQITVQGPKMEQFEEMYSDKRNQLKSQISGLGDGSFEVGLAIFDSIQSDIYNDKIDKEKKQKVKDILSQLPYSVAPAVALSKQAESLIKNLVSQCHLPQLLSDALKEFWIDSFGYVASVSWEVFKNRVETQNKQFLNSQTVKDAYNNTQLHLINYLLKKKLDMDDDNQISGAELYALYDWCCKIQQNSSRVKKAGPPDTMQEILQCLLDFSVDVNDSIAEQKTLALRKSGISADCVVQIVVQDYEHKLHLIETLDVSQNPIGDCGAEQIFRNILNKMPNVKKLCMDECMLADKIPDITSIIPQLESLSLSQNRIGDKGVQYIVQGLQASNNKMTNLDLSLNKITDKGLKNIMQALRRGSVKIEELELSKNQLSKKAFNVIYQSVKSEKCILQELYLNGYSKLESSKEYKKFIEAMDELSEEKEVQVFVDGIQLPEQNPNVQHFHFSCFGGVLLCFKKLFRTI
eukprot:TRINITY_DN9786_c0_g1_i2.p1 TRINITY_DN9786_c0_g1~~TRINITY_DN9786_c0_g1_i2.p1  ORF type:complete len:726 (+),score=115.20 TRINITY_DN9786_c0_g1_i2:260-2437(+)